MRTFFLHIGFPKTGTSYLQHQIFPNLKDILYLGRPYKNPKMNEIDKDILKLNLQDYGHNKTELLKFLNLFLVKNISNKYLFSHEGLLRQTRYNTCEKPITHEIEETLRRLNELFSNFGEVNFIITIRKYDEMLYSYFNQYYDDFKFQYNEAEFVKDIHNKTKDNILKNFFYGDLLESIQKLKLNHKILLYEDLKFKPNFFHKELFGFLKVNNFIFENKYLNSSQSNFRIRNIKNTIKNYNLTNLKKGLFKLSIYKRELKRLKMVFTKKKSKTCFSNQSFFKKYRKEIYDFYISDFNKLPNKIKKNCQDYQYLTI